MLELSSSAGAESATASPIALPRLGRLAGLDPTLGGDARPHLLALGVRQRRRRNRLRDRLTAGLQLGHDLGDGAGLVGRLQRQPAHRRGHARRLGRLGHRLLRERDLRSRHEEVVHEVVAGLPELGQVGGDAAVLVGEGQRVGLVDASDSARTAWTAASAASAASAAEEPAAAAEPTTGAAVLAPLGIGAVLGVGPVLPGGLGAGDARDEHVGADRAQRRQHLALGLVETVGHADDADHQPDAGRQPERGQDRTADPPPEFVRRVRQREHEHQCDRGERRPHSAGTPVPFAPWRRRGTSPTAPCVGEIT